MNTRLTKIAIKIYFLFLLTGYFAPLNAQDIPYIPTGPGVRTIFKVNTAALGIKNISVQNEITFAKRWSFALGASYLPERGLPSAILGDEPDEELANLTIKGFSVTPEIRFYFSGKNPKGFYAAPYLRYSKYESSPLLVTFDVEETYQTEVLLNGTYTQTSVGLMFGAQWKLSRKLVLDWWIIGGGLSNATINMNGSGDFSLAQQVDLSEMLTDIELPFGELDYTLTSTELDANFKPGLPTLRGLGICLGYIF